MGECCHGDGDGVRRGDVSSGVMEGDEGILYICPMCEGVERMGFGMCPKCGMALEPLFSEEGAEGKAELRAVRFRLWMGMALTLPLLVIEMGGMWGYDWIVREDRLWWGLFLSTPVVWILGFSFFERGLKSVIGGSFNMYTLIMLGTGVSWLYSVSGTFFPEIFPAAVKEGGLVEVYYEASAVIVVLVLWGRLLEIGASERTGDAVRSLMDLSPKKACVVGDFGEREVFLGEVEVGDIVRVKPGEKVAVDGEVVEGESELDMSMVTGESLPVGVSRGVRVVGGSLNGAGSFLVKVDKVGSETMLSQIVLMVARARLSRLSFQRDVDKVSSIFVPLVMGVALISFMVWWVFTDEGLSYGLVAGVSVLLIACPCALGLATPMSITVGVGRGVREGILVKDVASLELLERVDTVVFDKTGTLTKGKPEVLEVWSLERGGEEALLRCAGALGEASEHPLSQAVVREGKALGLDWDRVKDFEVFVGEGVCGTVGGEHVILGNERLMRREGVGVSDEGVAEKRGRGWTCLYVGVGGKLGGVIWVSDKVKETSLEAVEGLKSRGLEVVLLTGDSEEVAKHVGEALGIDIFYGGVTPSEKGVRVRELREGGKRVLMVGDGVNDAPALSVADVGMAMGTGTDIAMESAGMTLLHGDLRGVLKAIELSEAVMRNIRQNLFFAFVYNVLGVFVASGIFYFLWGFLLSPMFAAFAMSLSSVSVMMNALRLRFLRL